MVDYKGKQFVVKQFSHKRPVLSSFDLPRHDHLFVKAGTMAGSCHCRTMFVMYVFNSRV